MSIPKHATFSINRATLNEKCIQFTHATFLIPLAKLQKLCLVYNLVLTDKLEQRRFEFELRKKRKVNFRVNLNKVHFGEARKHTI